MRIRHEQGVYVEIPRPGAGSGAGSLASELLELSLKNLGAGGPGMIVNTVGGGMFYGFVPTELWPEALKLIRKHGGAL